MAKIRVYELARELGRNNKELEEAIRGLGIEIKNYMSTLTPQQADEVRKHLPPTDKAEGPRAPRPPRKKEDKPAARPKGGKVIRRRAIDVQRRRAEEAEKEEEELAAAAAAEAPPAPPSTPMRRPTTGPRPVVRPEARAPRPAAASPAGGSSPGTTVAEGSAPAPDDAVDDPSAAKVPTHAVGTRIELPRGTRRLPGGMAARLETKPGSPAPAEVSAPSPERAPSAPAATAAPESQAAAAAPASPEAAAQPGAPTEVEAAPTSRRVVRNEAGVIISAASQRSEPKILGFIPLAPARKRQQVIITDASDEDRRGRASQRKQREERAQAQGRRKKMMRGPRGRSMGPPSRAGTAEMSDAKKRIRVDVAIQVSDLAQQLSQKASNVLRVLWGMGLRGITINNAIDYETAELVAAEFGYTVENVAFQEEEILGIIDDSAGDLRAPVVTLMGHVDHGKTSLLDKIRQSRVAAGEAGGITQHIGAYKVTTKKGPVVFLDTPGHEAFTAMRQRGAQATDIVVLVVAADDGVMPTTIEALGHIKDGGVPVIVAINKMDKPDANPGRVKQALMEQGIVGEEFGGETSIVEVSAKTGDGLEQLLEILAIQAELMDLRARDDGRAQGLVLEARIDKGRGVVATVLVQTGTLTKGDILVANEFSGKVRGLFDHRGKKLNEAGPSTPVEILGLDGVPSAGDPVNVVDTERDSKQLVSHRREQRKRKESVRSAPNIQELLNRKKTPVAKIVLRADVQGTAQALKEALEGLSTEKVKVEVIRADVGQINETDVKYARAGDAVIMGFNVKTTGKAAPVAESEGVQIHTFSVIYDALDHTKEVMVGLLEPEYREKEQGEAEVRALFPIPRLGVVAGCRVLKGIVQRSSKVRVVREGRTIHNGAISSLRVFKEDVREVKDGFECGIVVDGFPGVEAGDVIQAYEVEAIPPTL